jgi:hypothetical protein
VFEFSGEKREAEKNALDESPRVSCPIYEADEREHHLQSREKATSQRISEKRGGGEGE